mmetsp:Transcript_939/g.2341  ORF Transcript_939/g.2341 Transcript_939/m.2341 type:complete len:206 (+) Transcript_939:378-995(+)
MVAQASMPWRIDGRSRRHSTRQAPPRAMLHVSGLVSCLGQTRRGRGAQAGHAGQSLRHQPLSFLARICGPQLQAGGPVGAGSTARAAGPRDAVRTMRAMLCAGMLWGSRPQPVGPRPLPAESRAAPQAQLRGWTREDESRPPASMPVDAGLSQPLRSSRPWLEQHLLASFAQSLEQVTPVASECAQRTPTMCSSRLQPRTAECER